ncbi:MAG: STAS/SEC14 domain-containing protein [Gammaproteobacteria bacterium]|nr:STAS/SEC14 domain-containing protein [Gammaproteobacteria bacterium]
MEDLDTGNFTLSKIGNEYVLAEVYTDHELTLEEAPAVLEYLNRYEGRVPLLVDRQGRYSLSAGAQLAFIKHAKELFSAIGFVDHSPLQRRITQIASITYLSGLPVKSFPERSQAEAWITQFGPLPPIKSK